MISWQKHVENKNVKRVVHYDGDIAPIINTATFSAVMQNNTGNNSVL